MALQTFKQSLELTSGVNLCLRGPECFPYFLWKRRFREVHHKLEYPCQSSLSVLAASWNKWGMGKLRVNCKAVKIRSAYKAQYSNWKIKFQVSSSVSNDRWTSRGKDKPSRIVLKRRSSYKSTRSCRQKSSSVDQDLVSHPLWPLFNRPYWNLASRPCDFWGGGGGVGAMNALVWVRVLSLNLWW